MRSVKENQPLRRPIQASTDLRRYLRDLLKRVRPVPALPLTHQTATGKVIPALLPSFSHVFQQEVKVFTTSNPGK